jgi:6-pyruvoyltetrahydropterin/6-carboxytetrahydropterin synthase
MSQAPWTIRITKAYLKFSAAHMTVYPDGTKEPLHGHNYQVQLDLNVSDASFTAMVDFRVYKDLLRKLCDDWDEMILLQGNNPHVKVKQVGVLTEVNACGKAYGFPTDEVHVLPIENITSELLAQEMATRLVKSLREKGLLSWGSDSKEEVIHGIQLGVFETAGQGASYHLTKENYQP